MRFEGWEQRFEVDAGDMIPEAPRMCLLHTMESHSIVGSMSTLTNNRNWPHGCYDPDTRRKVQGIDTLRAAKALGNKPGGVETNKWGPIQFELVGFANETHEWPDDWLRNIAADIVVPLYRLGLCDFTLPPLGFLGADSGSISAEFAPQRLTNSEWLRFHGICGHQHAPENGDRWDPGKLNVPRIIEHAKVLLGETPAPVERKEKMEMIVGQLQGHIGNVAVLVVGDRPVQFWPGGHGAHNMYGVPTAASDWRSEFAPTVPITPLFPDVYGVNAQIMKRILDGTTDTS